MRSNALNRKAGRLIGLGALAVGLLALPATAGAQVTFTSPNGGVDIAIPDNGQTSSTITVPPTSGAITEASAVLGVVDHQNVDDLDIALVGPTGVAIHLMSDACGGGIFRTVQFDDDAPIFLSDAGPCEMNPYMPSNYIGGDEPIGDEGNDPYAPPGPAATMNEFSFFDGTNATGNWTLYLRDDTATNSGDIANWSLTLDGVTLAPPTNPGGNVLPPTASPTAVAATSKKCPKGKKLVRKKGKVKCKKKKKK